MEVIEADVVIVGAGVAGALTAYRLACRGVKVVVLESGPWLDRATAVQTFFDNPIKTPDAPYPAQAHAPRPTVLNLRDGHYVQDGPATFGSTYERCVGGTTWHWQGTTMRFLPNDFRMKTLYGVAEDWPFGYDELEPWYLEAERELGVAGDAQDDLGSPRSGPYPQAPIPPTWLDRQVDAALRPRGLRTQVSPHARNSTFFQGRPPCCGNNTCVPICPIGAKYDASVHARLAQAAGATIVDQAVAFRIDVDGDERVVAIAFKRPDGSEHLARGRRFVLAAHAIETPRLLLMSASARCPDGVANRSGAVGRYLMDHPAQVSLALAREPVYPYRGPVEVSGIEHLREGAFRAHTAASRTPIGNDGWSFGGHNLIGLAGQFIDNGLRGEALHDALRHSGQRQVRLAALVEQLPDANNRVRLSDRVDALGLPRPRITYAHDGYVQRGVAEARKLADTVFDGLGAIQRVHVDTLFGAGHIMGTLRMGTDPASSVVDPLGRSHDHPNLWMVGSGLFPTGATANPTLTLAAMALRTADALMSEASAPRA